MQSFIFRTVSLLVFLFLLAGCGGGGGGMMAPTPPPDPGTRPVDSDIVDLINTLSALSQYATNPIAKIPGESDLHTVQCNGQSRCQSAELGVTLSTSTYDVTKLANMTFRSLPAIGGIDNMAEGEGPMPIAMGTTDLQSFGGWLKHSFFFADKSEWDGLGADPREFVAVMAHSSGEPSGSLPSEQTLLPPGSLWGEAFWRGAMVGHVVSNTADFGTRVSGTAKLDYTFSIEYPFPDTEKFGPTMSLSFSQIQAMEGSTSRYPDIGYDRFTLDPDGSFVSQDATLQGSFYGPNQKEAGGVFQRDGISGAFGVDFIGIDTTGSAVPEEH